MSVSIHQGDITTLKVDAIVNAANRSLLGGGGVDGAIHRAAGAGLLEECKTLNGCETGQSKLTKGYNLTANFIIHTVGPVWHGGSHNEAELLESCYRSSLELCKDNSLHSVAFPAVSTGVYGYPKEKAAEIALRTVNEYIKTNALNITVVFCVFDDESLNIYSELLKSLNL